MIDDYIQFYIDINNIYTYISFINISYIVYIYIVYI